MVTVTLQVPAFTPFTAVPRTRQYFALEAATFTVTRAPDTTVTWAPFRIDVPVSVLPTFTLGEEDAAGATVCDVVAGGDVAGDVVCAAMVVAGSELPGTEELLEELLDELDDELLLEELLDELVVVAAALVTANEYVSVDVPSTERVVKEIVSVAPAATFRVSVSPDNGSVPPELVLLRAAADDEAITVNTTEDEALGMLTVYEYVPDENAGLIDPVSTDTESRVDTESIARLA